MRGIDELLAESPALRDLVPEHRRTIAGCAVNRVYQRGEQIMREGEPADTFYVVRKGEIALETPVPSRGPVTVETIRDGDVLGWSWLVPPYRTAFGARAMTTAHLIAIDGRCLRDKCDADPAVGYALMQRVVQVMYHRLQTARVRLLDVYGVRGA